jgi:phosphate transport system protein
MPRETLDRQIHQLQDEVLLLGSMVEQAMLNAIDALKRRDVKTAQQIFENDQNINDKRFAIENAILIMIATQQPMAHDLRFLTAILEVINELERIGDYAKGIAKVIKKLGDTVIPIPMRELEEMSELSVSMLHRSLSAFVTENANMASTIPADDEAVDELYNRIQNSLVRSMIADPEIIDLATLVLWIDHNLERMADRAVNICERTIFIATGELFEMDTNDNEETD